MSTKEFTYMVREEITNDNVRYFAAFVDGTGAMCEAEISQEVYLALEGCRRDERRQLRSRERHQERLCLSEAQLAERAFYAPLQVDAQVAQAVDIQMALDTLTDTQRRRFLLYHEHGLSLKEIASVEGSSLQVIARSISAAQENFKYLFEEG